MKPREKNGTSLWKGKEEQSDEEKVRKAKSALRCYERRCTIPGKYQVQVWREWSKVLFQFPAPQMCSIYCIVLRY